VTRRLLPACSLSLAFAVTALAQGAALPVLQFSPSSVSHGMGDASVALFRDDPFAAPDNPAHLGTFGRSNFFSAGYDFVDLFPRSERRVTTYKVAGAYAGLNLKNQFGIGPEISVGLGYSRIRLDFGDFSESTSDAPAAIAAFVPYEAADNYSIGAGLHWWIDVAAGYTFKKVNSVLYQFVIPEFPGDGAATVSTYDLGLFLSAPVMEIVGELQGHPVSIATGLRPLLALNAGLAKNNLGGERVVYFDPSSSEPLPRTARAGVGVALGLAFSEDSIEWKPVSFDWTRESNDLLVVLYPPPTDTNGTIIGDPPPADYRGGFGDIHFVDDVILGKSNPDVTIKTGWQIELGEIVTIRAGRLVRPTSYWNEAVETSGYTLRLAGVFRILRLLDFRPEAGGVLAVVMDHFDLRYTRSTSTTNSSYSGSPDPPVISWMVKYSN